jgi:hypothetical protein
MTLLAMHPRESSALRIESENKQRASGAHQTRTQGRV